MSGKPNANQVDELKRYLEVMNEAADRVARIKPELEQKKADLEAEERRFQGARLEVWKLLSAMDCESSGNAGWRERFEAFLRLIVQYRRSQ